MQDLHAPGDVLTENHVHDPNEIDLGDNHTLQFFGWTCDRDLNPQWANVPDIPRCGAIQRHLKPDGTPCEGAVMFRLPHVQEIFPGDSSWAVVSFEPLTLSPSLFCNPAKGGCGDHGFIENGRWRRA